MLRTNFNAGRKTANNDSENVNNNVIETKQKCYWYIILFLTCLWNIHGIVTFLANYRV